MAAGVLLPGSYVQGFISTFLPMQTSPALPKRRGREGPTSVPGEEQNSSTVPSNQSGKARAKERDPRKPTKHEEADGRTPPYLGDQDLLS